MIWTLIRKYQIGSQSKIPPKKLMLAWINAVLHPHLEISNFSSDWNDGRVLQWVFYLSHLSWLKYFIDVCWSIPVLSIWQYQITGKSSNTWSFDVNFLVDPFQWHYRVLCSRNIPKLARPKHEWPVSTVVKSCFKHVGPHFVTNLHVYWWNYFGRIQLIQSLCAKLFWGHLGSYRLSIWSPVTGPKVKIDLE